MTRCREKRFRILLCGVAGLVLSGLSLVAPLKSGAEDKAGPPWIAPADARAIKNPLKNTPDVVSAGAESFRENCQVCHGLHGEGNGPTAKTLTIKPANFADARLMSKETDGSLFWKMSKGRGAMPAWEDQLSEKERWELVIYIRSFEGKGGGAKKAE